MRLPLHPPDSTCGTHTPLTERNKFLGELGTVRRYSYWSDRRVTSIAADNNIDLGSRLRLGFKTPTWGLLPQAEVTEESKAVQRHEVARRIERAIGQIAVEDFVTPPPAAFAKGCSGVSFSAYTRWYGEKKKAKRKAVVIAEVYHDVELDKARWKFQYGTDVPEPVDRIVIGAPLWVRSTNS